MIRTPLNIFLSDLKTAKVKFEVKIISSKEELVTGLVWKTVTITDTDFVHQAFFVKDKEFSITYGGLKPFLKIVPQIGIDDTVYVLDKFRVLSDEEVCKLIIEHRPDLNFHTFEDIKKLLQSQQFLALQAKHSL